MERGGSEFKTGGFTPNTTGNQVNTYRFVRFSDAWVLIAATANITV